MNENLYDIAKDFGLFFNKNSSTFSQFITKFPKVSFDKNQQVLRLYYQGPNGFGQQTFFFDFYDFVLAFEQKKFKHNTSKFDYLNFIDSFQNITRQSLNDRVKFVFEFFYITPTILKNAIHQNKKHKRKITLLPKLGKLANSLKNQNVVS